MLIPLLPQHRSAIDLETDVVILNLNKGDMCRIARFHRRSPQVQRLLQFHTVGSDHSLLQVQTLGSHRKGGSRVDELSLKVADYLETSLPAYMRRIGRNKPRSRLRLMIARLFGRGGRRRNRGLRRIARLAKRNTQ